MNGRIVGSYVQLLGEISNLMLWNRT